MPTDAQPVDPTRTSRYHERAQSHKCRVGKIGLALPKAISAETY